MNKSHGRQAAIFCPKPDRIVNILLVKVNEKIVGQPVVFSGPQAIDGHGRIKAFRQDRNGEQVDRTILRQKVRVPLLFLNGAKIADHFELEAPQHMLVLRRQAGQMIGANNQLSTPEHYPARFYLVLQCLLIGKNTSNAPPKSSAALR